MMIRILFDLGFECLRSRESKNNTRLLSYIRRYCYFLSRLYIYNVQSDCVFSFPSVI